MKHPTPNVTIACLTLCTGLNALAIAPNQTEPRGPHWHLFLDDHILTRSTGFERVLHNPKPRGIVLAPEHPWESFGCTPWYVGRRTGGGYECYYQTLWHTKGMGVDQRMAYAISEDGIHWEKPILNLAVGPTNTVPQARLERGYSVGGGTANNILPIGHPRDLFAHGNVRDPDKRYALGLNFSIPQRIAFCRELPDFIRDPNWQDKVVDSGGFVHSQYTILEYWDDLNDEWVVMRQSPNHPPTRVSGRYASPDLVNWVLDHHFYPDAYDSTDPRYFEEVYGLMGVHLEGIVFGFAYFFTGDDTHQSTDDKGLIGTNTSKGTMEVRVVVSRDGGKTWDRTVSRQPWIPCGTEQDSYDRQVRLDCPPLRMGDEDWFYATVCDADHGSRNGIPRDRIGTLYGALYTQKHNRYVSLRAGNRTRILITKPIEVTGDRLQLNVDAGRGEVKVAVAFDEPIAHPGGAWRFKAYLPHWKVEDRWGNSHLEEGFTFDDCEPIHVDSIEQDVQFKDTGFEALRGQTIRLYFAVTDADLYGFRFK